MEKKWNILEKKTKMKTSKMETKIVCPALMCSTLILVFSLVTIVYATMMIYIPANLEMRANVTGKVIIEKSRGEVSLMGQDTIENVS